MSESLGFVSGHRSLGLPRSVRDLAWISSVELKLKVEFDGYNESVRFKATGTEEEVEAFESAMREMSEKYKAEAEARKGGR